MRFPERTITDYAIKVNSIVYNLDAVTLCLFAKDNPNESSNDNNCPYSYAVAGMDNEFTFCAVPDLRVLIHGNRRYLPWYHVANSGKYRVISKRSVTILLLSVN